MLIYHKGFLEVWDKDKEIYITYGGNMGDSVNASVIPLFEERFGFMTFDRLRVLGKEHGSPDYWYELIVSKKDFLNICSV